VKAEAGGGAKAMAAELVAARLQSDAEAAAHLLLLIGSVAGVSGATYLVGAPADVTSIAGVGGETYLDTAKGETYLSCAGCLREEWRGDNAGSTEYSCSSCE